MYIQYVDLQGVPKKIGLLSSFEFLGLGGEFLGVKNYFKIFAAWLIRSHLGDQSPLRELFDQIWSPFSPLVPVKVPQLDQNS